MSGSTDTDGSARPVRDAFASGLLSKASNSLRRSPSRKRSMHSSSASIFTTAQNTPLPDPPQALNAASLPRTQTRPASQRTTTAPETTTADTKADRLDVPLSGDGRPQSAEASVMNAPFSSSAGKGAALGLSKSNGAVPSNSESMSSNGNGNGNSTMPTLAHSMSLPTGPQNPNLLYQHIQDMSNKRIYTLDYMRKAHEGSKYWFNTLHFSKADVAKLPSFTPARLSRRATNYFLLGLSIPAVLDVHPQPHAQAPAAQFASTAHDFLRSLNALLMEFEAFQQVHPADGSTASSLSRAARIPQMFKRSGHSGGVKSRRSSGTVVTDIGLPMQQAAISPPGSMSISESASAAAAGAAHHHMSTPSVDSSAMTMPSSFSMSSSAPPPSSSASAAATLVAAAAAAGMPSPSAPTSIPSAVFQPSSSFPPPSPHDAPNSTLIPNEGPYAHLLTPPLPFAPDFAAVFATLCDVLIDTYQRLLLLVSGPAACTAAVGDMFAKADARLRKVMVGAIVREFEAAAREGSRREVVGVQRMVLGGLMGG